MMPIAPLMIEHRLIERMITLVKEQLREIKETGTLDLLFIDAAVDFMRTYADRTHHGKEEDILFRDLSEKYLSREHRMTMGELIQEHNFARNTVSKLVSAKESYLKGDDGAINDVLSCLGDLVELYPHHIEKEDKHFFIPSMSYFSEGEKDDMLKEFWDFDRKMIHEKYGSIVKKLEDEKLKKDEEAGE
ncbi:cation-binding protein [Methanocella sp. CWC-04]|uniref:Cation-binding protein n=1 Tax=Methanooceanicella nereidis TaxID=2052831 RepID=A0AAP2W578_9EURY|nr:hemerythrin domain-containing protein [Methanocella sp. CWC-04]MCD1294043.1 cation-binding protein [Methanocella sp. CWC-04]